MWDSRNFDKNLKYKVYTHKIVLNFDGQTFHEHIRPKSSRTALSKINLFSLISSLSKLYVTNLLGKWSFLLMSDRWRHNNNRTPNMCVSLQKLCLSKHWSFLKKEIINIFSFNYHFKGDIAFCIDKCCS